MKTITLVKMKNTLFALLFVGTLSLHLLVAVLVFHEEFEDATHVGVGNLARVAAHDDRAGRR